MPDSVGSTWNFSNCLDDNLGVCACHVDMQQLDDIVTIAEKDTIVIQPSLLPIEGLVNVSRKLFYSFKMLMDFSKGRVWADLAGGSQFEI